jgi:MinD-like ATPase involved in chromosome partitioning or flagellar assembly
MLVAVISLKGSPGVTTFSVALAARWPGPARTVLVEADPAGGDVATRFSLACSPGLVSLAAAARRSADPQLVWQHTQALPGGLPVVVAPPGAEQAHAALSALAADPSTGAGALRHAATMPQTVVIADCGRVDASSVAMPIVRAADVMVLLSRAHADDLAHLASRLHLIGRWSAHPALLLVGEGYSTTEVARELGVPVMGHIPEDRHGAAVLCGRSTRLRARRGGPVDCALGQRAHEVARALVSSPVAQPDPSPSPTTSWPAPSGLAVPGVPSSPVSVNGVRVAPSLQPSPTCPSPGEGTSQGGAAS